MSSYNGWSNYETWCVHMWLTNDEFTNNLLDSVANGQGTAYEKAAQFKEWVEDQAPRLSAGIYSDLLLAALERVDWQEIIEGAEEVIDAR